MLKKLFHVYIHGSIHVALAVYALVRITEIQLGLPYQENIAYVAFYGTIVGYNFIKYRPATSRSIREYVRKYLDILVITTIALLAALVYLIQLPVRGLVILGMAFGFTLLYALPVLPNYKSLRYISGAKVSVVALCWSLVTVFVPALVYKSTLSIESLWIGIERFFFTFALTIPFEIRDLKTDDARLSTLPRRWGISKTKKLGYLFLSVVLGVEVFVHLFLHPARYSMFWGSIIIIGISGLSIRYATIWQHQYYSAVWVEAIPILWWVVLLLL